MIFMKADFNKQRILEVPEPVANNPSGRFVPRTAGGRGRQRSNSAELEI
jgi:hypothetical protein